MGMCLHCKRNSLQNSYMKFEVMQMKTIKIILT